MSTTKRVYLYALTFITLGLLAAGVSNLLYLLLEMAVKGASPAQVGGAVFDRQQLSLGLALLIIGGPLWGLFWRVVQRQVSDDPAEVGAAIRKFFLNLVLLVTAIVGLYAASDLLIWLLAGAPLPELSAWWPSLLVVTGAVWYYHWRISEAEGHPSPAAGTLRRWYVYILTGFGLVWVAVGLIRLGNAAIMQLPFWENEVLPKGTMETVRFWDDPVRAHIAWILLGGLAWWGHWLHIARRDLDATLRQVYYYLLAILGGALTTLIALTTALFQTFIWALGSVTVSAGQHFQFLAWSIPCLLVGAVVWGYHQRQVRREAARVEPQRLSAQRVHFYLMSFLSLGALVFGLVILIGICLDLVINTIETPVSVSPGWWRNQLGLCLALLLVGTPLWFYYWSRVMKQAAAGGLAEWRARSRRIFLYTVVGASIVILAADLVNIVYQVFSGLTQGDFGADVLRESRWSLQTLVVMAPVLWYHWRIVRAGQRRGAEEAVRLKAVTLIAGERAKDLTARLEDRLGVKVRVLFRTDREAGEIPDLSDEAIGALADRIRASEAARVMLVALGGKVEVLPYREK